MTDHLETGTLADVTETEEGSSLVVDVLAGGLGLPLMDCGCLQGAGSVRVGRRDVPVLRRYRGRRAGAGLVDAAVADVGAEQPVYSLSNTGICERVRRRWLYLDDEGDMVPAEIPTGMRGYCRVGDVGAGSLVEVKSTGKGLQAVSRRSTTMRCTRTGSPSTTPCTSRSISTSTAR